MEVCVTVTGVNYVEEHAHFGGSSCMTLEEMGAWLIKCVEVYDEYDEPYILRVSVVCKWEVPVVAQF